ncbi:ATP-binding protein [Streptomyces sp. NPDC001868]|uniref:ATP-binding protein n=1 Tax=Streptomyces sp. NPDC001868 TaxID=3154401 RepID=UPI00331FCE3B
MPVLRMEFGGSELPLVRSLVEEAALRSRLGAAVKGAFVQAALEISTNAVVHGGGAGVIELRVAEGELCCEVTDSGPGPTPGRSAGHGLRLAESLIAGPGAGAGAGAGRIRLRGTHRGTTATLSVPLSVPLPVPLSVPQPPAPGTTAPDTTALGTTALTTTAPATTPLAR